MTDLEKIRRWIATFPGYDILSEFYVDYTDHIPANGGIFPEGLTEISRTKTITGNIRVQNQYNFGIYCTFLKSPGDDEGAAVNSQWVMDFQRWAQEQSVLGKAPTFGDYRPEAETICAQNGALYAADEEGWAIYMVRLSVRFQNYYKNNEVIKHG